MAADPLRSWLELPEVMLERSLRERFDLAGGKVLNAVICRQEISAVDKVLRYHVLFEVITPPRHGDHSSVHAGYPAGIRQTRR